MTAHGAGDGMVEGAGEISSDATGVAHHDSADIVRLLDTVADRPLAEHPELFEQAHARLHSALAEIDGT